MNFRSRTALSALTLLVATPRLLAEQPASPPPEETGIYLYIAYPNLPHFDAPLCDALSKKFIDGALVEAYWDVIEPKPGMYDWTSLDRWVQRIAALHKRVSIAILAGLYTPKWLYAAGVPENDFDYNRAGVGYGYANIRMAQPSFWHPVYLREYGKMMDALSRHLREMQVPGQPAGAAYQALRIVRISGVNNTTDELRVDNSKPDNGPCHQSDAAAIWAKAGYTPNKAVAALMDITDETAHAFPGKLMSVAIIHRGAFPAIDNAGRIVVPVVPDLATQGFLDAAISKYRDRLIVQWDALSNGTAPAELIAAGKKGARIGFQMNGFMGAWGGSGYIYPHWKLEACKTPADFQRMLDNGLNMGAHYIEAQFASIDNPNWAPAFHEAHDRMWSIKTPPAAAPKKEK